jgi:hypothetical protein
MSYRILWMGVVFGCTAVLAGWGCSQGPTRVKPPGIDADEAGRLALEQYDTDKNGFIDGTELTKAPALRASMKNLDTNKDKKVSAEEITARIKNWQDQKVGKMSLMVKVMRRGRPLAGATVRFVPEKFLGDEIQTAEGVSDAEGMADLTVPPDPDQPTLRGVQCGLFHVEITKQGDKIPAMYNTQTVFGQECANDAAGIQEGIRFDLIY